MGRSKGVLRSSEQQLTEAMSEVSVKRQEGYVLVLVVNSQRCDRARWNEGYERRGMNERGRKGKDEGQVGSC